MCRLVAYIDNVDTMYSSENKNHNTEEHLTIGSVLKSIISTFSNCVKLFILSLSLDFYNVK
jgi:hypothetical protein